MFTDEDLDFINEIIALDGTEFGEYLNTLERLYDGGNTHSQMSEDFKAALEKEIKSNLDWAKESLEIVEYTVTPQPSKRRTIKYKGE